MRTMLRPNSPDMPLMRTKKSMIRYKNQGKRCNYRTKIAVQIVYGAMQCTKDHVNSSLQAGPPLSHARERRAVKRSSRIKD